MSETIIKIEHVSKEYRLGAIGGGTLRGDLQSLMARIRGKEDPNARIGQDVYTKNQRFLALDDVSFSIQKGERVGIIGHNGAGKSTLLKLLSRVTAPTKGTISYNGRIASMLEVGTGFHPELTGRENIYLNGAILGMTKAEIAEKFDDIVAFAEMEKFVDTPVKRYSSGMYVKLAFAVSAHLDSEIMIMDEVLAVGDMAFQKKCLNKMREAAELHGKTVLYVSHNMNTIRKLCSRCIVMSKGKIIFDGDVESAINIYLQNEEEGSTPFVSLENRDRPENSTNRARMLSIQMLDKEECVFVRGEPVRLKLRWQAKEDLEKVQFRFIVRYQDDSPIGLTQSNVIADVKKNEIRETIFAFDTAMLSDGKYFFSLALFQSDKVGNSVILDHVSRACSLEIISPMQGEGLLNWEHRWWGSVRFPDLQIIQ